MTSSRTIASWRLGHDVSTPLKHCEARAFHALSPLPAEADVDDPALLRVELDAGAVAGEHLAGCPPDGPTRHWPAVERAAAAAVSGASAVGTGRRARRSVVVVERPAASVVGRAADVGGPGRRVGGRSVPVAGSEDADGGDVVVGAAAAGERSPAGNVGRRPWSVSRRGRSADRRRRPSVAGPCGGRRRVAPATVVVVSPGTVVEVADGPRAAEHWIHRAERDDAGDVGGVERLALVLTPGRSTTMF